MVPRPYRYSLGLFICLRFPMDKSLTRWKCLLLTIWSFPVNHLVDFLCFSMIPLSDRVFKLPFQDTMEQITMHLELSDVNYTK